MSTTTSDLSTSARNDGPRVLELPSGRALIVPLGGTHEVSSWAIVNGGRRRASAVVWRQVRLADLGSLDDARALMNETLTGLGMTDAVGLMTARDVRRYEEERTERDGTWARCVATVGLGNALAAGDPPATAAAGTINLVCQVSVGLTEEALIEACALAAEARTAALLPFDVRSPVSGRPASGTGTDCIVIAAPVTEQPEPFAGKHTACGSVIGAAVRGAVTRGVQRWLAERACPPT